MATDGFRPSRDCDRGTQGCVLLKMDLRHSHLDPKCPAGVKEFELFWVASAFSVSVSTFRLAPASEARPLRSSRAEQGTASTPL